MNESRSITAKKSGFRTMTSTGMFAAMIALTTAYMLHIPTGLNGGYIHVGDAFIYLAACFLPPPFACAAASIGGGLADFLSGAPLWILPTMIIKPLTAMCFTSKGSNLCKRNIAALFLAAAISIGGYYVAQAILTGSWLAPLASVGANAVQAVGSTTVFVLISLALDRLNIKKQLGLYIE